MEIRVMRLNDYEDVFRLWSSTPGMGMSGVQDSRDGIEKMMKRNPMSCFVAEEDGRVTGAILGGHDGRKGYIYHAAVDAQCRRRGIGTALVNAVVGAFKSEGIPKAAILVYKENDIGNSFWNGAGWEKRHDLNYYTLNIDCSKIDG